MTTAIYIHANALIVGVRGVLLRGASGAGKSALTLGLIELAQAQGAFARLVGDDRISIEALGGRVIARPHPRIAGMIEARGRGILTTPFASCCGICCIVDLVRHDRAPPDALADGATTAELAGVRLPRRVEIYVKGASEPRILDYIQSVATN